MRYRHRKQRQAMAMPPHEEAQSPKGIDLLILALRAGGGYRYRTMLPAQDGKNLNTLIATAEIQLRFMAKSLEVAEAMLREPPPSMVHPRWDEYQSRREEALKQMMKKRDSL